MKPFRPTIENLEDRCVPVTWGNPWPDAANLSLSFAPDGTSVGDRSSELFRVLDQQADTSQWRLEILRAFQTWAVQGNINIGLVPDQGQNFGSAGRPQGDGRFGDVRVAGYEMPSDNLAIATPYESTAGTWSGDVKLNTAYAFGTGARGDIDLYTTMLHEAAHVFGLDHSSDAASAVFAHYNGRRTAGLTNEDIGRIQNLYGAREADQYEGTLGNDTLSRAARLSFAENSNGALGISVDADITSLEDADVYKFTAPVNAGSFNIRLQAAGLSLLNSKITVYNSRGRIIGSDVSTDPLNNDLLVHVSSAKSLATYYVKVEGSTDDVFGIGSYRLEVESIPLVGALTGLVNKTTDDAKEFLNNDFHTDDTFLAATLLPPVLNQTDSRFEYAFKGSLSDSWDVDIYQIQAPQNSDASAMSVMVWGTENNGLRPRVTVYDARHNEVEADVLVNDNGVFIVQVAGADAGATYFVKVHPAEPKAGHHIGNYFMGVDFAKEAVQLDHITTGQLHSGHTTQLDLFESHQSQLFHFTLAASANKYAAEAQVTMTVLDRNGKVLLTLAARTGQPAVSGDVYVPKGIYTIQYTAETLNGGPLPEVTYTLRGSRISDPIGPQPDDPTEDPSGSKTAPPPDNNTDQPPTSDDPNSGDGSQPPPPPDDSAPPPEEEKPSSDSWYTYEEGDSRGLEEEPYDDPYSTF